jgi:DNA-binding NarL/FixJ family response regulator
MESSTHKISIVLTDENTVIRKSWRKILENNTRFVVLGDCSDTLEAYQLIDHLKPDILIMDLTNSPADRLIMAEEIVKNSPGLKIIGISVSNRPHYAIKMISLGAKGYLTKTSPLAEIYEGIIQVYEGNTYICEEIRSRMSRPQ